MSIAVASPRKSVVPQAAPQAANELKGGDSGERRRDRSGDALPWAEFNQYRRGGIWTGHERLAGIAELQEKLPGMSMRDSAMSTPMGTPQRTPGSGSPKESPRDDRSPRLGGVPPKPFYAGSPISFSTARAMLPFLAKWVSGVCRQPLDERNLVGRMRNGLILCELVENLVPNLKMLDKPFSGQGLNPKPVSNKAMLANLERALCIAWKKGVHSFNMCPAEDFVNENVPKVSRCLGELFQALQMRDILPRAKENMLGMHAVLASLGRPLLEPTLHDPVGYGQHVVADFADCTRIMTLLTAFGYAEVEDLARLHGLPKVPEQWRENQLITNEALTRVGCPALLFPHEWASPPGNAYETIIFQLDVIWRGLNGSPWPGLLNNLKRFKRPNLQDFAFQDGAPLRLSHEHLQQTAANLTEISGTPVMRGRESPRIQGRPESPDKFSNVADGVSWLTKKKLQQQGLRIGKSSGPFGEDGLMSPRGTRHHLWQEGDDSEDLLLLQEFKAHLLSRFERLDLAYDAFDNRNVGLMNLTDFQRGCKAVDYVGDISRVFHKLDMEKTNQVGKAEFLALNSLPTSADRQVILWREGDSLEDLEILKHFSDRIYATFRSWDKAWKAIDYSHNGTVSQTELQTVQHRLDYHGDIRKVFALMDIRRDGQITRNEFDALQAFLPHSVELEDLEMEDCRLWQEGDPVDNLILLREFAAALHAADQFADLREAFYAFDQLNTSFLSITALHNGARQIEFTGDTQKLFVLLDVNKSGLIGRPEFLALDKLPPLPSTSSQQPRWRPSPRHKHFARNNKVELLVDFPVAAGEDEELEWPVEVVSSTTMEEGEARFPGSAEERAWLLEEDARRLSSLHEVGSATAARKMHGAMNEAAIAAEIVADEEELQEGDPSFPLRLQGTTSIDARVVMQDGTQQRMFVQTAVVDRTSTGSSAADDALLVVEVRDRTSQRFQGNALRKLRGQLDLSSIVAISQLGSATMRDADHTVSFSITARPSANLGGDEAQMGLPQAESTEEGASVTDRPKMEDILHWDDSRQFQVLYVVAGPSAWRRREAVRFFDELRILQHFVSDGAIGSAAASIGAAAGAAASAASAPSPPGSTFAPSQRRSLRGTD